MNLDCTGKNKEEGTHIMKRLSFWALLFVFLVGGCAHRPSSAPSPSSPASLQSQQIEVFSSSGQMILASPAVAVTSGSGGADEGENLNDLREVVEEETPRIADSPGSSKSSPEEPAKAGSDKTESKEDQDEKEAGEEAEAKMADPLEPFNRAMFQFNDKLYFWALKPVARGYNKVVPEPARVSVKNFFTNLAFPIRFVSRLLQADFSGAATELGRFAVNTIWGIGGLMDPSSSQQLNIPKGDADIGQTLGVYGLGQGFYLVLPLLGPSSARDSVGMVGNYFLYPVSYIPPWYASIGVRAYEEVNNTSLRIGDYESLKEAAIDPYVALRDAYAQYRQKMVEARKGKPEPPKPGGVR
jgi:phospholipid-binding lipoprotein MlaA